jgi:prepilin-type N-terminal cleavage/methylation domain-containing protein
MRQNRLEPRGFTLVELAVTLTVLGLLLAFSVPAFTKINRSYQLKNATENAAGTMRLWRERAIASGNSISIHFNTAYAGSDWHMHEYAPGPVLVRTIIGGQFPTGVSQYTSSANPWFEKDGRVSSGNGSLVLQSTHLRSDGTPLRDTVTVLTSGLILQH